MTFASSQSVGGSSRTMRTNSTTLRYVSGGLSYCCRVRKSSDRSACQKCQKNGTLPIHFMGFVKNHEKKSLTRNPQSIKNVGAWCVSHPFWKQIWMIKYNAQIIALHMPFVCLFENPRGEGRLRLKFWIGWPAPLSTGWAPTELDLTGRDTRYKK